MIALRQLGRCVLLIVCGFGIAACGDDTSDTTVEDQVEVDLSMACTDEAIESDPNDDSQYQDSVATNAVERCIFYRGDRVLRVILQGQGDISIGIAGFDGSGTYTTDGAGETIVELAGAEGGTDTAGEVEGDDSPRLAATLDVTTDLTVDGTATTGFVTIDVDLPQTGASAVGQVTCDVTPGAFSITVAECEALD